MKQIAITNGNSAVQVEPPYISVTGPVHFFAPQAAHQLLTIADTEQPAMFERMLELGAEAYASIRTSTTLKLVETQIGGLDQQLNKTLSETLTTDRTVTAEALRGLLDKHGTKVNDVLRRYLDADSQDGVAVTVATKLAEIGDKVVERFGKMLADGDEGVLAKVREQIIKEIREQSAITVTHIAAKRALLKKSPLGGRPYEEAVAAKIAEIVRVLGDEVDRCGDKQVRGKGSAGDIVIKVNPAVTGGEIVTMVVEAKERSADAPRFSANAVAKAIDKAIGTRTAVAGIFVADSSDVLPNGLGFGKVRRGFYVAFDPDGGDDVGLAAAIYLARAEALMSLQHPAGSEIDRVAAQKQVAQVRELLDQLTKVDGHHQAAIKAIGKAGEGCDELKSKILGGLRRLDELLAA